MRVYCVWEWEGGEVHGGEVGVDKVRRIYPRLRRSSLGLGMEMKLWGGFVGVRRLR